MHPDLEAVVAADEECRSRLTLAESRRDRDRAAAAAQRDASIEKRRGDALAALELELAKIRSEGDEKLAQVREQQRIYLDTLQASGEKNFDAAVQRYLAVVGAPEER